MERQMIVLVQAVHEKLDDDELLALVGRQFTGREFELLVFAFKRYVGHLLDRVADGFARMRSQLAQLATRLKGVRLQTT